MVFMTSVKINMAQWMHGVTVQKFLIFLPLLQLSTIKLYVFMVDYLLILIHLVSSIKINFWYRLIHGTCNLFRFCHPLKCFLTARKNKNSTERKNQNWFYVQRVRDQLTARSELVQVRSEVWKFFLVLVQVVLRFLKFFWNWSGPGFEIFSVRDRLVVVRGSQHWIKL